MTKSANKVLPEFGLPWDYLASNIALVTQYIRHFCTANKLFSTGQ
jgi:hypothetical protein